MSNHQKSQAWWVRTNKETLDDRVKAVQNVNDPSIMSDDVQRWSKVALFALLAFTTLLSGASYLKFFEKSFGFEIALIMALLLACVIEFGKNWGFLRVLRIPFFQGWNYISSEVANSIMWFGLLLLSVVTFAASVYNSTQGAKHLSLLLSHERSYKEFSPNTQVIDAQIIALQQADADLGNIKRKNGKTNWAIQPMKAENAKTLASLQQQRETSITQQRADWEQQMAVADSQNKFSAGSLLAVGGWVELLQIILMFIRVAAERSLDKTATDRRAQTFPPYQPHNGNGTTRPPQYSPQNHSPIGFFWQGYGETTPRVTDCYDDPLETSVSQSPLPVSQILGEEDGDHADDVLLLAMKRLKGFDDNFDQKHRKNETVRQNIHDILDAVLFKMKGTFRPSADVHAKFSAYVLDELFPLLHEKGFRYPRQTPFEGWLRTVAPVVIT